MGVEKELIDDNEVHVACDTGLFWSVLHNQATWIGDFENMAKSGVVFSFADHAFAEIVNQFEQGKFTEGDYVRVMTECSRFISPKVPILPGKRQLACWCDPNADIQLLDEDRRYRRQSGS